MTQFEDLQNQDEQLVESVKENTRRYAELFAEAIEDLLPKATNAVLTKFLCVLAIFCFYDFSPQNVEEDVLDVLLRHLAAGSVITRAGAWRMAHGAWRTVHAAQRMVHGSAMRWPQRGMGAATR